MSNPLIPTHPSSGILLVTRVLAFIFVLLAIRIQVGTSVDLK